MRIVSFTKENGPARVGALLHDDIVDFTADPQARTSVDPRDWFDADSDCHRRAVDFYRDALLWVGDKREEARSHGHLVARSEVTLLAPVPRPGKVICIGLNYRDHAAESGMDLPERPLVFSKFPTSITGPGATVRLPDDSREVDYEAELAVVIGRRATRVERDAAMQHVLGYANFNDVSARDFQFADGQWQRGKSCDTFAPMGPFLATPDEVRDPHDLRIQFRLNGKTLQDSSTNQLIFRVPELIAFLSRSITLEPGDVIATGTPPGVGFARKPPIYVQDGDVMEVEIEGLGVLESVARSSG